MQLTKGLFQGTVVVIWAVYAVVQVLSTAGGGRTDPAAGTDLLVGYLGTLPTESLVAATAAMVVALVGLEVVFVAIRRFGRPRTDRRRR